MMAVGDRPTVLAAHVSAALGLPGNPPAAAEASRNKLAARRAFACGRLADASFQVVSVSESRSPPSSLAYPVVVKPLGALRKPGRHSRGRRPGITCAGDRSRRRLLQTTDIAIERERRMNTC